MLVGAMSKKHPERSDKRRQARAERRRVETKQRKAAERAQQVGVPRKPERPGGSSMRRGQEPEVVVAAGPVEPPPEPVVRAFQEALAATLAGAAEVVMEDTRWYPAKRMSDDMALDFRLRLLGRALHVTGWVEALDTTNRVWPDAYAVAAESLVAAIREEPQFAGALILLYALGELLLEDFELSPTQAAGVIGRFGVASDVAVILDIVALRLPGDVQLAWSAAREDGVWDARICSAVFEVCHWEVRGSLADLGRWVADACRTGGWRPPWWVTAQPDLRA